MDEKRIAHYDIVEKIGAGGMGEVYRARDTKLERDVAIKIIPPAYITDPDRLSRFEREAKLLAALNHTNIAAIYGFEESGESRFLIMEMVEGEDIAKHLARGSMLMEDAIDVATQVANALEYAHDQGIVHRDLKPANIQLTPEGHVKVLDFGLAKALESSGDSGSDLSQSPTMMASSPTLAGVILGTAAYMSPEQARGKPVDKRSDIFAFGIVLFEMLGGHQLFVGETVSDTLAAVLRGEPDYESLPTDMPPALIALLKRCLDKDPKSRLRDIGEARIALDRIRAGEHGETPSAGLAATQPGFFARFGGWMVTAVVVVVAGIMMTRGGAPVVDQTVSRLAVMLPGDEQFRRFSQPTLAISPDGNTIAMITSVGDRPSIMLRDIRQKGWREVPGTEGCGSVFFSPDGEWIGFVQDDKIKRVLTIGGTPQEIADAPQFRGADWAADDTIVYSPMYTSPLYRVRASGGVPQAVTELDSLADERTHRWPQVLPDGEHVLFTANTRQYSEYYDNAMIDVVSMDTGKRTRVIENARMARYLSSGHIVFARGEVLYAVRFSLEDLAVIGVPFQVMDDVNGDLTSGVSHFYFSRNGTMVHGSLNLQELVDVNVVDREGRMELLGIEQREYHNMRMSPDGERIAFSVGPGQQDSDLWIYDLEADTFNRLTFDGESTMPLWSRDGTRIYYAAMGDVRGIQSIPADGSGDKVSITTTSLADFPTSISRDGIIAFTRTGGAQGADIFIVDVATEEIESVVASPGANVFPSISRDGQWLAYSSDANGQMQAFVIGIRGRTGKWQISSDGGFQAKWNSQGDKIYYYMPTGNRIIEVDVTTSPTFSMGAQRTVFEAPHDSYFTHFWTLFLVDEKRDRILFLSHNTNDRSQTYVNYTANMFSEIRRLDPNH
jgi:Tol biopolymer transport system component